jgi:lysophospholipase L1-like esterase
MESKSFYINPLKIILVVLVFQFQNLAAQVPFAFRKSEIDSNKTYNDSTFKKLQRFEREIKKFDNEAKLTDYTFNGVLFLGSSSIRLWKTLEQDFSPNPIVNRGFGGATIPEILYYFERISAKCKPSAIVVYAGENDLAFDSAKVSQTLINFKRLMNAIFEKFPKTQIYVLSIKPSPKRWNFDLKFMEFNDQINRIAKQQKYMTYVDIRTSMLSKGDVRRDIFQPDSLHLNNEGYRIWTKVLQSELKKSGFTFDDTK